MGLNLGPFDSHQTPPNINHCLSSSNYSQDTKHNITKHLTLTCSWHKYSNEIIMGNMVM